jgi:hypothetical protein
MPNYIKNRIELLGEKEQVEKMIEKFSTHFEREPNRAYDGRLIYHKIGDKWGVGWYDEKTGEFEERDKPKIKTIPENFKQDFNEAWTRFPDFNKIVEMPESLHVEIHSGIETAVKIALKIGVDKNPLLGGLEMMNREKQKSPIEFDDKEWEQFITCLNNVREHGFIYWYDWSVEKWGTKWNSSECEKVNDNTFDFTTAWNGVPGLIEKMSKEFPDVTINYEYSDEDTGSNCGIGKFLNGEVEFSQLESQSNEAYELAFKLRPEYKDNYKIVDGKYEYTEED